MNAEERAILDRTNQLVQELLDRDWLELGVSQEELDRSRLSTQQMYAALREGYSMDEVLQMFDCLPEEQTTTQEKEQASSLQRLERLQATHRAYRKKPRRAFTACTRCRKRERSSFRPSTSTTA